MIILNLPTLVHILRRCLNRKARGDVNVIETDQNVKKCHIALDRDGSRRRSSKKKKKMLSRTSPQWSWDVGTLRGIENDFEVKII